MPLGPFLLYGCVSISLTSAGQDFRDCSEATVSHDKENDNAFIADF
jgi:hypothetical protein